MDTHGAFCLSSVFVHRYRDVAPLVRTECIDALGKWMLVATDLFLTDNYLKYVGWMLSDKDAIVRRRCLNVLIDIYDHNVLLERMHTFLMRFKERLLEMTLDVDLQVRILALRALSQLSALGLLDVKDLDNIADLVVDEDPEIRRLATNIARKSRNHFTLSLRTQPITEPGKLAFSD